MLYIVLGIVWYLFGCSGFIYWITTEYDFTPIHIPIMLINGFSGPLTFLIGYFIHANNTIVIIKKKTKQ